MEISQSCPCGSGKSYQQCCQPIHLGKAANNAEKLMRARYSAYALKNRDFILQSWAQEYRPKNLQLDNIQWIRLKVLTFKESGTNQAEVHFIATWKEQGKAHKLEENSLFEKRDGQWYYLYGKAQ